MKNKQLKRLKSVDEIPKQMMEETAAEFYGNHDLADIWDELELVEEPIAVSPRLRESMIYLRLEPRYLVAINQLAQPSFLEKKATKGHSVSDPHKNDKQKG